MSGPGTYIGAAPRRRLYAAGGAAAVGATVGMLVSGPVIYAWFAPFAAVWAAGLAGLEKKASP